MDDSLARSPSPTLFTIGTKASPKSNQSTTSTSSPQAASTPCTSPPPDSPPNTNAASRHGRRGRRRKVLGLRTTHTNQQKANDPFDYEQKYAEDEEFKEMGPMARVWRVFLDECGAFDSEMVEDWRDALDVLLVFAGLFSAVVTTFVAQTSQKLEIDFTEVNAHLMFESLAIERAKAAGSSILEIPASKLTPFTPFRPSRMAVWVNGLWFTSLALSLTTALMAVLTKQWIHQYLSVPSGTPQDRCRIRQFRFMSLENWHVPVIIGLLPVLMHVALGIFLAGLVVFLCSFNTSIASTVGSIAVAALVIYFSTNLLPIFKPDCPYKTPLTLHCHDLSASAWLRIRSLLRVSSDGNPLEEHMTLKATERERVKNNGGNMDVQCLSWLYNMSSNSSVQRVVLQALSNIQLQEVEAIQKALPTLSALIRNLLSDYVTPDRRLAWERLFRALNRFDDWHELSPDIGQESPVPNSLSLLFHRGLTDDAIQFLRQQIIKPTVKLDALSWARILRNVLWEGVHWLDVNDNNSKVWTSFRDWFLYHHTCNKGVHESRTVWTVKLLCQTQLQWKRENLFLHIVEPASRLYEPPKSTSDGVNLQDSIYRFFRSSVSHFLTSNVLEGLDIPTSLPGEIRLHLALLQSPATLETSAPYNTETQQKAPLGKLIDILRVYVDLEVESSGWRGGTLAYHPEVTGAIFKELYTILNSPSFDAIRLRDRQDMLHPLIRTLVLDGELREKHGTKWLSATVIDRIINATFADPDTFVAPVVNEILDYYLFCRSRLAEEVYRHLLSADWAVVADRESADGLPEDPTEEADEGQQYTYPFLISSYIDGFQFLKEDCSALYEQSVEYISRPRNLLAISKILVLGDIESRTRMWKLASLLQRDNWTTVLDDVDLYLGTEAASARYENQVDWLEGVHPFHLQVHITWTDFEELEVFVAQFRDAIRQESVLFPLVTPVYNMPKQKDFFKPIPEAPN